MLKKIFAKVGAWILLFAMMFTLLPQHVSASETVTPSKTKYTVILNGSRFFIHNEKTIGSAVGTEYFMTYTVKRATTVPEQHGLVGTEDPSRNFQYSNGGLMRYAGKDQIMLDEGATYFIKFTVAKGGFRYEITRAKGDDLTDLYMSKVVGEATDKMGYFGLQIAYGKGVDLELSNVRFYDKKGNDLGVKVERPSGVGYVMKGSSNLSKAKDLDHRYEVSLEKKRNIAISNVKIPTTSRVYLEYKVESAEYLLNQEGISISDDPESDYPHRNGALRFETYKQIGNQIDMLDVGAEYIISIDRQKDNCYVLVQKKKDGKTTSTLLSSEFGTYKESFDFISLWFGAGGDTEATFKLVDFRIYDANKNNLGVQTNVASTIMHYGEMEDYAGCEATYYCKKNGNLMALYGNQSMKYTTDETTEDATYRISENVMKAKFQDGEKKYDYLFKRITDSDNNEYERLYTYQVSFVTGTDAEIDTQTLTNKTGYSALRPTDPKMENYDFEGWFTKDGEEYDFEQIVTESKTLYAKWSGDGGIIFTANDEPVKGAFDATYIFIGSGAVLLVAGLAVCVVFIRKGIKDGNSKKKTNKKN